MVCYIWKKISFAEKLLKFICFDAESKLGAFWGLLVHVYVENNTTYCI